MESDDVTKSKNGRTYIRAGAKEMHELEIGTVGWCGW